jgi:alkylation response protein AidB-like acyl-CoA dehydrogenase
MSVEAPELTADQLREQTKAWLHDNLPAGWMEAVDDGDNDRWSALRRGLDYGEWCKKMGEAGYATPTWPAEYGAGLSLSPAQAKHVNDVLSHYKAPRSFNIIGIGMGGPTILAWGTEAQKERLLRPCATNEEIWCQLFSEPGAGSDVAGLSTRAVRDGDEWVVNGQKVWTTLAHIARWGMLVARTDPDQPKHRGLTYFILDMHAPGVEVRPLVQITGEAEFNEVFFADARIPDSMRVGAEGDGWRVAITTLMNERVALSGAGSVGGDAVGGSPIDRLIGRHQPVVDQLMRQRLAQAWIDGRLIRWNNQRASDKRKSGAEVGPEGSITKLMQAEYNQRVQKLAVDLEGVRGTAWEGDPLKGDGEFGWIRTDTDDSRSVARGFLRAQANTIEGGTSNIMRNILGERVLGLPKEPDASRDLPWKDVPRNA